MSSVYTLSGHRRGGANRGRKRHKKAPTQCKITKTGRKLCFFGKSKKAPTGWLFVKD